jgi:hypothetical protein
VLRSQRAELLLVVIVGGISPVYRDCDSLRLSAKTREKDGGGGGERHLPTNIANKQTSKQHGPGTDALCFPVQTPHCHDATGCVHFTGKQKKKKKNTR